MHTKEVSSHTVYEAKTCSMEIMGILLILNIVSIPPTFDRSPINEKFLADKLASLCLIFPSSNNREHHIEEGVWNQHLNHRSIRI